ncbi:MAG: hypothetical protein KC777_00220 [Cyanobacteria bacterium HKST-UBA02]|nr:hypothetical protein [Cyanobacteria bacterium HKST-UBA02]
MNASTAKSVATKKTRESVNFLGLWRNQHGSEVYLAAVENGLLTGTFKTGVGAHDPDEEFALTGFISDDLISFSVNFGKYGCLTSWSGQHTGGLDGPRIETMWHLARAIPEKLEARHLWAGFWTGADTFKRVEGEAKRDLNLFDRPTMSPSYPFKVSLK